ncbi:MAG: hypothetical protein A3G81_24775 [Betaproteobacteria bacterium RIFCSPLOWO2_12_FULL_65_14]|nr:MAG: hypothetical protein A3G81_24775 [Betaproteobacteria bacterium RIFCSPLOWO2_12_FULL_65_14]
MAWQSSAIAAAELRVVQSRRELRGRLRHLQSRLSPALAWAAAAGVAALVAFSLMRRGRWGALAGTVATALIRHAVQRLIARANSSM